MKLQEEYFKRHNISLPPIYHTKSANLILKLHVRPQVVLHIEWKEIQRSTGYYVFKYCGPNHNGYLDGNYFLEFTEEKSYIYQYDEYRRFITTWAKNLNFSPFKSKEVRLAVWEMFMYSFDGWIAENWHLEEIAFLPLNEKLSFEERMIALDQAINALRRDNAVVGEIYDVEFRRFEVNYADWLADLIEFYAK